MDAGGQRKRGMREGEGEGESESECALQKHRVKCAPAVIAANSPSAAVSASRASWIARRISVMPTGTTAAPGQRTREG